MLQVYISYLFNHPYIFAINPMKLGLSARILSVIALAVASNATFTQLSNAQSNQNSKFVCGMSRGVPATLVRTSRGNIPIIRWVDTAFPQPWTPERRCEEISSRFQRFYDNGTLDYLRAGKVSNQSVLCVAGERGGSCLPGGILVTLKPGTSPQETLDRIMDYRGRSSGGIIELSGAGLVSLKNDAAYLDMKKMIAQMDGSGTSTTCPTGRPVWKC